MALGKTSRGTILKSYIRGAIVALCVMVFTIIRQQQNFQKYDYFEALFAFGIIGVIFEAAAAGLGILRVLKALTFILELLIDVGIAVLGIVTGAIVLDQCKNNLDIYVICRANSYIKTAAVSAIVAGSLSAVAFFLTAFKR